RGLKLFEQFAAWRTAPLHKKVHFLRHEKFLHLRGHLLQIAVAREKNKGATVRLLDKICDALFQFFLISSIARVRHFLHDEDFHLLLKIERTPKLQRLGFGRTDARPKIRQVGAADRERGAGHDAAAIVPENHSVQHRREVNRRSVERKELRSLSGLLNPVNMLARALLEEDGNLITRIANAPAKFLQFSF